MTDRIIKKKGINEGKISFRKKRRIFEFEGPVHYHARRIS